MSEKGFIGGIMQRVAERIVPKNTDYEMEAHRKILNENLRAQSNSGLIEADVNAYKDARQLRRNPSRAKPR